MISSIKLVFCVTKIFEQVKMNNLYEICERICPITMGVNVTAIGISLSDVEVYFKLASYGIAIIWTTIKVIQELRNWNEKKSK